MAERLVVIMCEKKELSFSIFMLYSLADKWKMSPAKVYKILNSTGILDNYIIKCYDVLHTQGKEYLVEDITDYVREKGVNVYELSEEWDDFKVLSFEKENEKWLDFVCACRKGQPLNKEYDIIIGNVADDDVFKTVDMYFRGLWDKEKVLGELRYYKMNNQICIVNQETLNRLITFKRAYEVDDHGR